MTGIILDTSNDIQVLNGSMLVADATQQNQALLLYLQKGELKENPLVGVGIENYLNDEDGGVALIREIKRQFVADGMTVNSAEMVDGQLYIDASYED